MGNEIETIISYKKIWWAMVNICSNVRFFGAMISSLIEKGKKKEQNWVGGPVLLRKNYWDLFGGVDI